MSEAPCDLKCEVPEELVPEGKTVAWVPAPRHDWPDVHVCPNDCGRAFILVEKR